MTTRAAIYARRSVDADDTRVSVDRQLDLLRGLVEVQLGQDVDVVELVDNDLSAGVKDVARPAFDELVGLLEAGRIDVVLTAEQSRLTRRPAELEKLLELLDRKGVRWITLTGEIGTRRGDRTSARIRGVVDADESERASVRASTTHAHSRAAGKPVGPAPYGYRNAGDRGRRTRVVDESQAVVVKRVVDELLAGRSLEEVARGLNDDGIPSPRGAAWRGNVVRTMVTNPAIAGIRAHRAKNAAGKAGQHFVVDGPAQWPAIIDEATFSRVRDVLNDRDVVVVDGTAHRVGRRGATTRRHALSGVLECGKCGSPMRGSATYSRAGERIPTYRCSSSSCGMSIRSEPTEELVVATVLEVVSAGVGPRLAERDGDAEQLRQERAELLERQTGLAAAFGAGQLGAPAFEAGVAAVASRLAEVERRIAELDAPRASLDAARATLTAWHGSSMVARRLALAAVIERIVVRPAAGRSLAERLEVVWRA